MGVWLVDEINRGGRKFWAIIADEDGELVRYYIHNASSIGQYTGRKSKHGIELYEGDICKGIDLEGYEDPKPVEVVGEIIWVDFDASFEFLMLDGRGWGLDTASGLEVIGNTYENPEFLTSI